MLFEECLLSVDNAVTHFGSGHFNSLRLSGQVRWFVYGYNFIWIQLVGQAKSAMHPAAHYRDIWKPYDREPVIYDGATC